MIYPGIRSEIGSAVRTAHDRVASTINFEPLLVTFFASGVKGVWHERSNIATLYQESTAINSAVAGSVVGLGLSKDAALARGAELWSEANSGTVGESQKLSSGAYRIYSSAGAASNVGLDPPPLVAGRIYEASFVIDSIAIVGSGIRLMDGGAVFTTTGAKKSLLRAETSAFFIKRVSGATDYRLSSLSLKEVLGNHQLQATAGARPVYQAGPKRLVFDGVDDVLNTTFTAALGVTCTVGRAIPGTGAVISAGVNIGTSFADSVTAGALLIADRALSASEATLWTAYLNQQASL